MPLMERRMTGLKRTLHIRQLESGDFPVPVLHLKFGKNTGDVIYDSSPEGNDGTKYGPTWAKGWLGPGLLFDGLDDYAKVDHDDSITFSTGDFTIIIRVKFTKDAVNHWLFTKSVFNVNGWELYRHTGGSLRFYTYQTAASQITYTSTVEKDVWMEIAIVRDGSSIRFYRDLVDINTISATHIDPVASTEDLTIGIHSNLSSGPMKGILDEVIWFNEALTAAQRRQIHYGYR